jgi:hypothetical protein
VSGSADAVHYLADERVAVEADAARRNRLTATRLAAAIVKRLPADAATVADQAARDAATADAIAAEIDLRTRARLRGPKPGWLAAEIERRGGAPYSADDIF